MMNDDIRQAFAVANPFAFRHITHLKSGAALDDVGPCVVMATPSMLQARWGRGAGARRACSSSRQGPDAASADPAGPSPRACRQIGRASCRERV